MCTPINTQVIKIKTSLDKKNKTYKMCYAS